MKLWRGRVTLHGHLDAYLSYGHLGAYLSSSLDAHIAL